MIQTYQKKFLDFIITEKILRFGEFTLKSGRKSPYFFNIGLFSNGQSIAKLGDFYAQTIQHSEIEFDVLFGPAYKGIPLVTATAISLSDYCSCHIPYCFNRKEVKEHGEGGMMIGAPLNGRVLLVDDVITAGTAIQEVIPLIQELGAQLAGVVVAFDRQEKSKDSQLSAVQMIEKNYQIPVISIINLEHIIEYLEQQTDQQDALQMIANYRKQYGV